MASYVPAAGSFMASVRANGDVALAFGVFGMLALLMVPLPPLMLDIFLALSITL